MRNRIYYFGICLTIGVWILFIAPQYTFAPSSASFNVSPEVFAGGGGTAESTNYELHGKLVGKAYGLRTSTNYRINEGFFNASFQTVIAPIVTSISPDRGNNNASVFVTINGANFDPSATASLEMTLQTPITAEGLTWVSANQLTCTFNLLNRTVGAWDVVVRNPDGRTGTLSGGFTVNRPSGGLTVTEKPINYPNPFDPDTGTTTIKYVLSRDAKITLNIFNINGQRIWQHVYPAGTTGGQAGTNLIVWDGNTAFSRVVPNGIYVFQIESGGETLATGKIAVFR